MLLPASNQFRDRIVADVRAALARAHDFNVAGHAGGRDHRMEPVPGPGHQRLSLGLKILLTIIGTFTLSIGAVGVVNIMLVSVTERTREIGVLKALGARRRHILRRSCLRALMLTLAGGFLASCWPLLVRLIGSLPFLGALFEDTSGQRRHPPGWFHLSALIISSPS